VIEDKMRQCLVESGIVVVRVEKGRDNGNIMGCGKGAILAYNNVACTMMFDGKHPHSSRTKTHVRSHGCLCGNLWFDSMWV